MDSLYQHAITGNDVRYRLAEMPCAEGKACEIFGEDGFSFKDILDVVNPLQQLPVVGTLYRAVTGDTISAGARMAGGFLIGGPIGFMVAAINAGFEAATGDDITGTMIAMVTGSSDHQYAMNAYQRAAELG